MTLKSTLREVERRELIVALTETRGNIRAAARQLGLGRSSLYNKCEKHGIDPRAYKAGLRPATVTGNEPPVSD